jgi:hypothetical protein
MTERPPLTGKKRYVPKGLYDQPWDQVTDAYGKATLTPFYIEALTSDDEGDVQFGVYGLSSATTHQGSVYKSSQMAIPFLVDLLTLDNAAEIACHFLARIALGENHFISAPSDYSHTKYFGSVKKYKKEIKTYYDRTGSEEAMRLLCFLPGMLPDYIDLSYEHALKLSNNDKDQAYTRQASNLIAQGFIAAERNYPEKGYPMYASQIDANSIKLSGHIDKTRKLIEESPSRLVRGCAAICLAYTGIVDAGILDLLAHFGEEKIEGVAWTWDNSFSGIAKKAWLYSVDIETLIDTDKFLTLDYTSKTVDGIETKHYSASERLATAASRTFPVKYSNTGDKLPLLPAELTAIQKSVIKGIIKKAPGLLGKFETAALNLPVNTYSALRSIEESSETLCTKIDGFPLWFILEKSVFENTPEIAVKALQEVDAWKVLSEVYRPFHVNADIIEERCYLNLKDCFDDKKNAKREEIIEDILANSLAGYDEQIKDFLDEWLIKSEELQDYDWKFKALGQRIGICLLSLARADKLCEKYYPLVRPYHPIARFSNFPIPLLKEVLEHTSQDHQAKIKKQFKI